MPVPDPDPQALAEALRNLLTALDCRAPAGFPKPVWDAMVRAELALAQFDARTTMAERRQP